MKTSSEIRNDFLQFFREKEHLIVNSVPVVPADDPTLLFINAGMNPFKPIFLGEEEGLEEGDKVWKRAADTQKCIRVSGKHNDLEEVGIDTYHHTLFEMLGNWSFGDYFKAEAIEWAWELLVDRWGLNPDRLYATVFEGDEEDGLPTDTESINLWRDKTGIRPEHILQFGKKDNFWEMGDTGPCGPCSEIHIDLRSDEERKKTPGADLVNAGDPRVMEIWNLVFIQFNRRKDGSLESLPAVHVDTGMGFERICAVLQGKNSNYDSDLFAPLLTAIGVLGNVVYGKNESTDIAMRVIADHIRAVTFAIADGASPSNEGRGYVIRRILRRAIRYGWDQLQLREPFMYSLVDVLGTQFQEIFPEVREQSDYIKNVIRAEESSFLKTLGQGIELFTDMTRGKEMLSGEDAFKLHDTYGFPIDLTELMAREKGIRVDTDTFQQKMEEQRARARASGSFAASDHAGVQWFFRRDLDTPFEFTGYDRLSDTVSVTAAGIMGKKFVLMLDRSPFYAESGGQVADHGVIRRGDEVLHVLDVQKSSAGPLHVVDHLPAEWINLEGAGAGTGARTGTGAGTGAGTGKGTGTGADSDARDFSEIGALDGWLAEVDTERRAETEKHHSATHLLHAALRNVLGEHVAQKGSLVAPDRLRFDFSHFQAVKENELAEVEEIINKKIQENISLQEERDLPMEEAKERGAMMLFGEKYGDRVRMITFDPEYSVELCGGTHVAATGRIGYFRFVQETSVASGIRRVEAVTGMAADHLLRKEHQTVREAAALLGSADSIAGGIQLLIDKNRSLEKELEKLRQREASGALDQVLRNPVTVAGVKLYCGELKGADMNLLKQQGYEALKKTATEAVIVLGSRDEAAGKVYLMVAVTEDLIARGIKAGAMVSDLGKLVGGGGGGQPTLATAGGRFPEKLSHALDAAKEWLENIPNF
jgi:alanyl-tRNA synthetase